jgi:uncharacterized membrane protein YbhN (UPF0104 family)
VTATDTAPRKWWSSPWLKIGLSAVLLAFLLGKTDISELADAVMSASAGWVLAALIGYLASQAVSSIRWAMLARPLGFDAPVALFFTAYFKGVYMNLFAPSTVAGDIGRALYLAGGQRRRALAFTTVIADRGLGFVVLSWVGAVAVLAQPGYHLPAPLYYSAWIVPPATLFGWLYLPQLVVRAFKRGNRWRQLVDHDLKPYWKDFRLLTETSLVALLFHVMQVLTQALLARALGLQVPLAFFFIFVPVVNILGMVPVSFSGIGIREAGYLFFLAKVGIARHTAVALGLLSSAVVLATGITSGLAFLVSKPMPSMPEKKHSRAVGNAD